MKIKNFVRVLLALTIMNILCQSCKSEEEVINKPIKNATTRRDTSFLYEYRTEYSGHFTYNYDITGIDKSGNQVSGNITMDGKYGKGFIYNKQGEKLEVQVVWIDIGILKAIDHDGMEYVLQISKN